MSSTERLDQIENEEIPEVIQEKLAGKEYRSWRLERAYTAPYISKIKPAKNDSLYYVLELRRGSESIRVRFDEAGNKRDD